MVCTLLCGHVGTSARGNTARCALARASQRPHRDGKLAAPVEYPRSGWCGLQRASLLPQALKVRRRVCLGLGGQATGWVDKPGYLTVAYALQGYR